MESFIQTLEERGWCQGDRSRSFNTCWIDGKGNSVHLHSDCWLIAYNGFVQFYGNSLEEFVSSLETL